MTETYDTFESREALTQAALAASSAAIEEGAAARGGAAIALSGGSTPLPLYEALSETDLPWSEVTITLADERQAPDGSDARNDELLRRHLLKDAAAAAKFVPLVGRRRLDGIEQPLDLVILGMGEDGHTASLFPEGEGLAAALSGAKDEIHEVTPAVMPKDAPYKRLTLTPAALAHARTVLLLVTGLKKRAVLDEALRHGQVETMPVRSILHARGTPLRILYAD